MGEWPESAELPAPPLETLQQRLLDALRDAALRSAFLGPDAPADELNGAVCALVRRHRGIQTPPERVVVECKRLVERAYGLASLPDWSERQRSSREQATMEQVLRWCLDEYYGPETRVQ